jgi:hypothetical protein
MVASILEIAEGNPKILERYIPFHFRKKRATVQNLLNIWIEVCDDPTRKK